MMPEQTLLNVSAHTINIGVPPPASKRALPTPTKTAGGLSRVYERAKPATTATLITTMNGTDPPSHPKSNGAQHPATDDAPH